MHFTMHVSILSEIFLQLRLPGAGSAVTNGRAVGAQQLSNLLWALTILRLCRPEVQHLQQSLCATLICHCHQIVSVR